MFNLVVQHEFPIAHLEYQLWAMSQCHYLPDKAILCTNGLSQALTRPQRILYYLSFTIYNLLLNPLRQYPGPRLWAISRLPWTYYSLRGQFVWKILELHQRYGPIVRIAPDELEVLSFSFFG